MRAKGIALPNGAVVKLRLHCDGHQRPDSHTNDNRLNRLARADYPDGTFESTEFDAAGRAVASTDRRGKRATMEYDAAGRQTASVDASGRRTSQTFDENGNRTSVTVDARTTNFTYDALNRLTKTQWPDGSSHNTAYRADNRKDSETDVRGVTTSYGYDAAGRLISVAQSLAAGVTATTAYSYDETGAKTTQVDALGRTTTWALDANGRITSRKIQDGSQESSRYDIEGNRLARTTFAGEQISYQYDSQNRLTGLIVPQGAGGNSAVPGASALYKYTAAGQLESVQEQGAATLGGTQAFQYDALDRLIATTSPLGQISYTLDGAGNAVETSVSNNSANAGTTRTEYDDAGRRAKVTAPDGKETRYTYDAAGRLMRTERDLNNGAVLTTHHRHDGADRVIAIAHTKKVGATEELIAGQALTRAAGGAISRIDTYRAGTGTTASFDAATGQFTGSPAHTSAYEYDGNARLTRESRTNAAGTTDTRYEYDAAGNRTKKTVTTQAGADITTYAYDSADRLMQESTSLAAGGNRVVSYTYDGNGNRASKTEPGLVTLYRFDPQNRLIDIRTGTTQAEAQAAAPGVSYTYDASGNRIRKGGANASSYLIDSSYSYAQVVLETKGSDSTAYVRGLQLIRQTKVNGPTADDLFPLHGHLDTSLGAVDVNGNVVEQVDADAFGNPDQPAGLKQTHLYVGEYWDQDAQLLYLRARWYDPEIGSFISADPFEGRQRDPRSLNRYAYARSDPVHGTDPSGRETLGSVMVAVGINAGIGAVIGGGLNYLAERDFKKALYAAGVGAITGAILGGVTSGVKHLFYLRQSTQVAVDAIQFANEAVIVADKLRYLTVLDAGKAKGFELLGYTTHNLPALEKMLKASLALAEKGTKVTTQHGVKTEIKMTITGPNGKEGMIEVVWQQDHGSSIYRFITAIPHPFK